MPDIILLSVERVRETQNEKVKLNERQWFSDLSYSWASPYVECFSVLNTQPNT